MALCMTDVPCYRYGDPFYSADPVQYTWPERFIQQPGKGCRYEVIWVVWFVDDTLRQAQIAAQRQRLFETRSQLWNTRQTRSPDQRQSGGGPATKGSSETLQNHSMDGLWKPADRRPFYPLFRLLSMKCKMLVYGQQNGGVH